MRIPSVILRLPIINSHSLNTVMDEINDAYWNDTLQGKVTAEGEKERIRIISTLTLALLFDRNNELSA